MYQLHSISTRIAHISRVSETSHYKDFGYLWNEIEYTAFKHSWWPCKPVHPDWPDPVPNHWYFAPQRENETEKY